MQSGGLPEDINLVFKGIDGAEAESFIRSVQRTARTEGRTRDNEWIADLVSTCMTGEALRWYAELDEDTHNDWKLLRKAILRQYPSLPQPSGSSTLPPTIPIPAAAATPSISVSHIHSTKPFKSIYRIRVYFAKTKSDYFLSADDKGRILLTSSDKAASNVCWNTDNNLQLIKNGVETQRKIGLTWYFVEVGGHIPSTSTNFARLWISDPAGNAPLLENFSGASRAISWTQAEDGSLEFYCYHDQTQCQHQFYTQRPKVECSLAQICLLRDLESNGIGQDRVFTIRLEPI